MHTLTNNPWTIVYVQNVAALAIIAAIGRGQVHMSILSVHISVCLLVTKMYFAKMADSIKMPLMVDWVD